jgi:hypothetical protein
MPTMAIIHADEGDADMNYVGLQSLAARPMDLSAILCPLSCNAIDTAMVLFLASAHRAKEFALAMHERTVWGLDHALAAHWADVVVELRRMTIAQQDSACA